MGSGKIQQILLQGKRPARGIFCFINRFNVDGVSSVCLRFSSRQLKTEMW